MKRLRAWLGVLAVFLLGVVCGGVLMAGALKHKARTLLANGGAGLDDPIVGKLRRELGLDATQEAQVRKVVTDTRLHVEEIKQQTQPVLREARSKAESQVRALLRPEQLARFDELVQESHGERAKQP